MLLRAVIMSALALDGAEAPPSEHASVEPVTARSHFDPLTELWGLQELSDGARLEDLDGHVVLYLSERARFQIDDRDPRVYLAEGRQVLVTELTEADIEDYLGGSPCLCALEFEPGASAGALHTPAGAYRLMGEPSVTIAASGIERVELRLSPAGQSDRVTLRRLVCWSAGGGTIAPLTAALPGFARLARKVDPGFADPPVDDRLVQDRDSDSDAWIRDRALALADLSLVPRRERDRLPRRLDAPELLGAAEPGIGALWDDIRSGRQSTMDYSGYYVDFDPLCHRIDRQHGVTYRDPWAVH